MVKNLRTRLVTGMLAMGIVFTLSGCKKGIMFGGESDSIEIPEETVYEEPELVVEETIEPVIEETPEPTIEPTPEPVVEDNPASVINVGNNDFIKAIKTTNRVNLRSTNSTDGEIYTVLEKDEVIPFNYKLDNGWYEVNYDGLVGYVCGDYVVETFIINKEPLCNACLNKDSCIYDEFGNVIGNVPYLEFVKIYEDLGDRYFVDCDGVIGYLSKDDVTFLEGTYVVVDISSQKLVIYRDNIELLSTSVVTGKDSTPSDLGLFDIDYKGIDVVLRGANYESHVNYWMPYNGGEGLHDATWRNSFGGEIYHTSGSHGCINMPLDKAQEAYGYLSAGDKVLVKR